MARRRRLTPAQSGFLGGGLEEENGAIRGGGLRPPIAQVAGDTAASAALEEMSEALRRAETEGRMVMSLPLDAIEADHLIRDRVEVEPEALAALERSVEARGQQTPIEVLALPGEAGRYGLISGWRRLLVLRRLAERHGDRQGAPRFDRVLALVRRPDSVAASYVAMVEENEVRADLSHFERARVVLRALEAGVFADETEALRTLFAAASYPRRSKIKSFLPLVAAFDGALRFPGQLTERQGLALAKALETEPALGPRLRLVLETEQAETAKAEAEIIAQVLLSEDFSKGSSCAVLEAPSRTSLAGGADRPRAEPVVPGVTLKHAGNRIELRGDGIDDALAARLRAWLEEQLGS